MNDRFDEITLTLENDANFYRAYLSFRSVLSRGETVKSYTAHLLSFKPTGALHGDLIEYFDERYAEELQAEHGEAIERQIRVATWSESAKAYMPPREQFLKQFETTPEPIMPTKFFEAKKFLNGVDVATLSEDAIYSTIAAKEAGIKKLEQIENKPKSLLKKIEDARGDIKALVDYLDSKAA